MNWNLPENKPFDVVCFGYNSVDILCRLPHFPVKGKKLMLDDFSMQGGGQSATASVALSRWGFSSRYIGKFGGGQVGRFARESTQEEGVDLTAAIVDESINNQLAVIWVEKEGGERTITYTRPPELEVRPEELNAEAICSGKVLLIDAHQIPATLQAAKWAKEAGIPVVLDAERNLPGVEELLSVCDYILCDNQFPADFTGEKDPKKALLALKHFGKMVSVTLGKNGSLVYYQGKFIRTPGHAVKAVDTTGAGDIFHAGFVAGMLQGLSLEDTLRYANIAAALKCRKTGGRAGIPQRDEVLNIMSRQS